MALVVRIHLPMQETRDRGSVPETQETQVRSLEWQDLLQQGMATHCIILAWEISCKETGRLPLMGPQRVGHD